MRTRVIFGLSGPCLTAEEAAFFERVKPWGFILFARNIVDPDQVRLLTAELRQCVDDSAAPILVDHEGGRVSRLNTRFWKKRRAQAQFGTLYLTDADSAKEATYLNARLIAEDLTDLGISVNSMPVLDVPAEGADAVIGDRAFSRDALAVVALGRAVMDGLIDGGILPVMKHMPGHGRASADSHSELPRVAATAEALSTIDFMPFRALNTCPMAMTAHVVYEAFDAQRPATTSPKVIRDVVRGEIGFDGLLMTDDVSMGALSGPISARVKAALFAGCDVVLHCNGSMEEMEAVALEAKPLEGQSLKRAEQAFARSARTAFDRGAAEQRLEGLIGAVS